MPYMYYSLKPNVAKVLEPRTPAKTKMEPKGSVSITIPEAGGTRIMTSRARHDSAGVRLHRLVTYIPGKLTNVPRKIMLGRRVSL